jgi:hypothetical protein
MPLVLADRVNETTTTTGTGTVTLAGAVSGYQSFAVIGNANTTYYTIVHQTANEWEVGIGTYTSSGTLLSRDTVLASSNSGSPVNFSAGTKFVFCDYPAGRAVYLDTATNATLPNLTLSGNLTFSSTAQRIVADMSSATAIDRFGFVTSTANSSTIVSAYPSGTGSNSAFRTHSSADPTNSSWFQFASTSTDNRINSSINGTGTYLPITFFTNGSEQARLDTSGNLGIGTTSPGQKLTVAGGSVLLDNAQYYYGKNAAGSAVRLLGVNSGNVNYIGAIDSGPTEVNYGAASTITAQYWNISGTEGMRLTSTGLGIGTSSPAYPLQVRRAGGAGSLGISIDGVGGTDRTVQYFAIQDSASGVGAGHAFYYRAPSSTTDTLGLLLDEGGNVGIGTSGPVAKLDVVGGNGDGIQYRTSTRSIGIGQISSQASLFWGSSTDLTFFAGSELARLTSAGNLGIGTTSPGAKLDVSGGIRSNTWASNNVSINANPLTGTSTSAQNLRFLTTGADFYIGVESSAAGGFFPGSTAYAAALYNANATPMQFWTSGALRATLDSSGNLGIGTSSPAFALGSGLEVQRAGVATLRLENSSGSNGVEIAADSTTNGIRFYGLNDAPFVFAPNAVERMRLDSSGNLGIGTSSPSTYGAVVIIRNQNSDARMWVRNDDAGSSSRCSYVVNASGNSWSMGMGSTANNGNALTWLTDVGGGNNEMMRLTTSGNLGIGTTSPATKFVVSNGGALGFEFDPASGLLQSYNRSTSAYGSFICDGSLFTWRPSGTEAMRLTSAGRLGIATSIPEVDLQVGADTSTTRALSVRYSSVPLYLSGGFDGTNALSTFSTNAYANATGSGQSWTSFSNTSYGASAIQLASFPTGADIRFLTAAASNTNPTERARITSAGNLQVQNGKLVVSAGSGDSYAANLSCAYNFPTVDTYLDSYAGASYSGQIMFRTNSGGGAMSERARIDSNGRVIINGTAQLYSSTLTLYRTGNSYNLTSTVTGTGNEGHVVFENGNGAVGTIFTNGTATAYNTSSDYRLKNTIAPMTGALAKVALLKPCTYKWNADGSDGQGFIAHELAEVVPQCVTGEKDAVDAEGKPRYQGVDTSFLVATLTAAIQELTARVAQLETK